MKIIHIIENIDNRYGGPAKSVPLLIKYLNKLNIQNKIITLKVHKNEENEIIEKNNINITKLSLVGLGKVKYSPFLKKEILKEISKDTIIHIHSLWNYTAYIGYKIAKENNIPLVVSIRGTMYDWALEQRKYLKKFAMWLFQKDMLNYANILHITEIGEKKVVENFGIKNNFVLVPNGVELDNKPTELSKNILDKINYNKHKIYFMFLGRIVHNKGIHYIINSAKSLELKNKNIEILVVGGIEEQRYYNNLEKLDNIHFLGMLDGQDKHTIFSISSLFILPSLGENFGMAIAEAMTYKLPIITTKGTPWKEIEDNNAGWWVELNQDNINNTIIEAITSSKKQLSIKGQNAYEIIKNYTWDVQAIKMMNCYLKLLNKEDK